MDATTSITPAQVVALAEQISNGAKGIQQKLDDLDAKVNTLRASWDGAAQEAGWPALPPHLAAPFLPGSRA